ncbi:MAG TPA: DUF4956 domain-containing protein [Vicinamibacterales bacterium]|jgi:uncharacterized membrane protein YhiD involved in acid resistance|nr:DUF4956 domain-containing protein [Vicinamibacterales bacterium]
MPEALVSALSSPAISPVEVVVRLVLAFALGAVIAWIYRQTRGGNEFTATFPGTLVLLAVLIAMVTQVIGDSVARAFSLVGALSIVRFRTVVRDTQDTAFVIFAVVVGMAVGARDPWVAMIGIAVVGAAAFVMAPRPSKTATSLTPFVLEVRIAVGHDLNETVASTLDEYLSARRLISIGTAKQGIALDASYSVRIRNDKSANDLVKALNRLEGVQSVQLVAREETDAGL